MRTPPRYSYYYEMVKRTGRKKQSGFRKIIRILKTVSYRDGDKIISISPYDGFKITGELAFDDNIIRTQKYTIKLNSDRFDKEISRARTFGYVEQVEELWANSLALGGTLES